MKSLYDFRVKSFRFADRDAKIFYPDGEANGKLVLKTEYLEAFPDFEIAMLERGYTLCFIAHPTRWAPDSEIRIMADFFRYVAAELGMEPKCIAVGMSCGGLQAVRMAQLYPELVSVLYLDAPVMNLLSLAGMGECTSNQVPAFWSEMVATYGFTRSDLVCFRNSPIDHMQVLIENKIPIIMLYGDADDVVLYRENGQILEDYYRANGGDIRVICRPGFGHHPHSLTDPTPIVEFVESRLA